MGPKIDNKVISDAKANVLSQQAADLKRKMMAMFGANPSQPQPLQGMGQPPQMPPQAPTMTPQPPVAMPPNPGTSSVMTSSQNPAMFDAMYGMHNGAAPPQQAGNGLSPEELEMLKKFYGSGGMVSGQR